MKLNLNERRPVDCTLNDEEKDIREVSRITWVGVAVNILLSVCKLAIGSVSRSQVLIADGVHTLSDLVTDAAVLIGVRYWTAPADRDHQYGHRKIETLVTLGIGLALALVGIGMGYEAVVSLHRALVGRPDAETSPLSSSVLAAFAVAVLSIVAKELLYRWTAREGRAVGSSAVIANAWHHRSDAVSSIPPALAIGANVVGAHFGVDMWYLDPIGTVIVCFMLLEAAWSIMRPAVSALLDAGAGAKLQSAIEATALATPGVRAVHKTRSRCIGPDAVSVDLHVMVAPDLTVREGHDIAASVKYRLLGLEDSVAGMKVVDVIVHLEPAEKPA